MKTLLCFLLILLVALQLNAQAPQNFNYQAVLRDASGTIKANQSTLVRIDLLQTSVSGTSVYAESFSVTTNSFGLINLQIGKGSVISGTFSTINWGSGPYFMKLTVDGIVMGSSQLLSVPYALYAAKAGNGFSGNYNDLSNKPVANQWKNVGNGIEYKDGIVNTDDIYMKDSSEIFFSDYGQIRSLDNFHRIMFRRNENILEFREYGDIVFSPGSISGTETKQMRLKADGNIELNNKNIQNVADPINEQDVATKAYVDELLKKLYAEGALRVRDFDGNYYNTIKIGTQIWMAENLKTTTYNNGSGIPNVNDGTAWSNLTTPAYCWYNNDAATYKNTYGALYNWYTVNTGKLCPTGWHVPTDAEWTVLEIYLENNGYNYDGTVDADNDRSTNNKVAKSLSVANGWNTSTTTGAVGNSDYPEYRNKTGFAALPAGVRNTPGPFYGFGNCSFWWSTTQLSAESVSYRSMFNYGSQLFINHSDKISGFSVRCIKD